MCHLPIMWSELTPQHRHPKEWLMNQYHPHLQPHARCGWIYPDVPINSGAHDDQLKQYECHDPNIELLDDEL